MSFLARFRAFSGKTPDRSRLGRCRVSGAFGASVRRFFRKNPNPGARATPAGSLPGTFPSSCELCLRAARRSTAESVTGRRIFFSGTPCCVRQARIASRRFLIVSLTANTPCSAVDVLAQPMNCAAVLLAAYAPLPQGTAVLFCKLSARHERPHTKHTTARTPPCPGSHFQTTRIAEPVPAQAG